MAWFGSQKVKGGAPMAPVVPGGSRSATLAPAPVAPATLIGGTAPIDTSQARSTATGDALRAAMRARKKAVAGTASALTAATPGATTPAPVLTPRSLVGR